MPPAGKLYTPEQIQTLAGQAEERGRAEALGMLLGRTLLDENGRTAAIVHSLSVSAPGRNAGGAPFASRRPPPQTLAANIPARSCSLCHLAQHLKVHNSLV
jgi:hypothetical protein